MSGMGQGWAGLASRALYARRSAVAARADRLRALFDAVDRPGDLSLSQWSHLFAVAVEFHPDLILELGRGRGNSTCVFTQAAHDLPGCRVVSFCIADDWDRITRPRLERVVPAEWFAALDARTEDVTTVDFGAVCRNAQRVLVFWDAHGFEVAASVLARLMPVIADRPHLVVMHDITDTRYCGSPAGYQGRSLWRGQDLGWAGACAPLRLGWMETVVEQAIPTLDFLARNGIELHSADDEVHRDLVCHPERLAELRRVYPSGFFAPVNHWVYFTLNDAAPPYHFPAWSGVRPAPSDRNGDAGFAELGRALSRDLGRNNVGGRPTPLTWLRVFAKLALGRYHRIDDESRKG